LCERVADWARALGVTELASDALIDNHDSHAMHRALGFAETERIVFFRRALK
jgi:aminoglycoside 6'-N-acetyltransferase I